ncbi:alpha/beta hydrolase [Roseimicrobium sp. ORNL1]|uniref:alpha/beta hydrolase n=1 Tax=Roseimicrobium sp. ORNL1 TaxID=2711231 RepID=UPI0013E19A6C|nr:alpha/beta hydrolase [Roseimicrobium sp. ORNL1]QIF02643.1 alpha/beta hydrolase [Roseimicrobium sp. ORNL1]
MSRLRILCLLPLLSLLTIPVLGAEKLLKVTLLETKAPSFKADIPYKVGDGLSEYEKERCKLDLYLPTKVKNFPVVVWFHGGGLTGGQKAGGDTAKVIESWVKEGIAVASVNYRLSPKVKFPAYIEDGAAAVAWVQKNIASHGGDPRRVFIGGHSAGAYLSMMLGLDTKYLTAAGVEPTSIAGLLPVSGQTMTHFTVREERGLPKDDVIADEAAPIHFVRKDAPPMLLLMGDKDWPARLEENQYFAALFKVKKHEHTTLIVVPDRTHGTIFGKLQEEGDAGRAAVLKFIADPIAFGKQG